MTAAFSMRWQAFRLVPYGSPSGRTGLCLLRSTFVTPEQLKAWQHLRSMHAVPTRAHNPLQGDCVSRPTRSMLIGVNRCTNQLRWVSRWRGETKKPQREQVSSKNFSLTGAEINGIFGQKMNTEVGLDVLRTLHERRLAGTLDRKLPYPEAWVANGLAYLRAKHPFDEDSAIVSRIDREKNYKSRTPQTNTDQSLRSVSQFERLRQHNTEKLKKARLEAEEKQKFEAPSPIRVQKVELRDSKSSVPTNEPVRLRPEPEWVQRYREKATNHDASIIFKLGTWSRLLPSAVFTISVVSLSIWFAQNYKAPTRKTRIWPDIPSAAATMITITGINVAVFLLWRIPQFWSTMNRICLVTPVYPYAVSMLGAPLSHQHSVHLLGNMFFLWFAGTSRASTSLSRLSTGLTFTNSPQ